MIHIQYLESVIAKVLAPSGGALKQNTEFTELNASPQWSSCFYFLIQLSTFIKYSCVALNF